MKNLGILRNFIVLGILTMAQLSIGDEALSIQSFSPDLGARDIYKSGKVSAGFYLNHPEYLVQEYRKYVAENKGGSYRITNEQMFANYEAILNGKPTLRIILDKPQQKVTVLEQRFVTVTDETGTHLSRVQKIVGNFTERIGSGKNQKLLPTADGSFKASSGSNGLKITKDGRKIIGYTVPGVHKVYSVERIHDSKAFGVPLNYFIRFNNEEGQGFHINPHPDQAVGKPASGGCVRLSPENAAELYRLVRQYGLENDRLKKKPTDHESEYINFVEVQVLENPDLLACTTDIQNKEFRIQFSADHAQLMLSQATQGSNQFTLIGKTAQVTNRFGSTKGREFFAEIRSANDPDWSLPENFNKCFQAYSLKKLSFKDLTPTSEKMGQTLQGTITFATGYYKNPLLRNCGSKPTAIETIIKMECKKIDADFPPQNRSPLALK